MTTTWVLVADENTAKILIPNKDALDVSLEKEFIHPRSARKAYDAQTDIVDDLERPAPVQPEFLDTPTTQASHRKDFAREIGVYLEKAHTLNRFSKLIVVANPEMMGLLRTELAKSVKNVVLHELQKDLLGKKHTNLQLLEIVRDDLGIELF